MLVADGVIMCTEGRRYVLLRIDRRSGRELTLPAGAHHLAEIARHPSRFEDRFQLPKLRRRRIHKNNPSAWRSVACLRHGSPQRLPPPWKSPRSYSFIFGRSQASTILDGSMAALSICSSLMWPSFPIRKFTRRAALYLST